MWKMCVCVLHKNKKLPFQIPLTFFFLEMFGKFSTDTYICSSCIA